MPLEMHAIHYKKEYLKMEVAKKYEDGLLFMVYFFEVLFYQFYNSFLILLILKFQLKSNHNPVLDRLLSKLPQIQKADTKVLIEPFAIHDLIQPFMSDYFIYYGSIATSIPTPISWMITRKVTAISPEQVDL